MARTRRSIPALRFGVPILLSLAGALPMPSSSAAATAPPRISRIVLERTCFGCADAGRLVLRSDGSATLTEAGNARQGTVDRVSTGRFAPAEFERLAAAIVASGFFGLDDRYEDPELRDGTSTTLEVERVGVAAKQVFRREDAGPAALAAIDAAIAGLRGRIRFDPVR